MSVPCPGCTATDAPAYSYTEWLQIAYRAIERGLNQNAIWRLHEKRHANHHDHDYELGGEA